MHTLVGYETNKLLGGSDLTYKSEISAKYQQALYLHRSLVFYNKYYESSLCLQLQGGLQIYIATLHPYIIKNKKLVTVSTYIAYDTSSPSRKNL